MGKQTKTINSGMKMEPITSLHPAEYNPRNIANEEYRKLKRGLTEFGMVEPIVVNQNGTVIGGHQRLKAAADLGWTEVPVVRLDLDEKQEKALNLALNRLSGEWDYSKLTSLLSEFESDFDFDIELTGFDSVEAADLTQIRGIDNSTLASSFGDSIDEGKDVDGTSHSSGKEIPGMGIVIQYNIIFRDKDEQEIWHAYLKWLKKKYPDMQTISQRLIAEIEDRMNEDEGESE